MFFPYTLSFPSAFVAYLGFIHLLVAHSHPVMLMFCQLLISRNKDRTFQESLEQGKSKTRARFRIQGWLKMGAGWAGGGWGEGKLALCGSNLLYIYIYTLNKKTYTTYTTYYIRHLRY